jgi:protein-S-isoprenylcysteine O-methyltransferase Ste14
MGALLGIFYAVAAYVFFLATFAYAVLFIGDLVVPKTIDTGALAPAGVAVATNVALLGLFAVQHSVMARRGFKRWWTTIVPAPLERSTFVLCATAVLALVCWQWRPMPGVVWTVDEPVARVALWAVFWAGWGVLLASTFLIDHFELFGLKQAWRALRHRPPPVPDFRTPLFYRYVRHPLYVGFVLAFWAAPTMSVGRLLFAIGATGYILVGIAFEERDLIAQFGDRYRAYRDDVGMLVPRLRRRFRSGDALDVRRLE